MSIARRLNDLVPEGGIRIPKEILDTYRLDAGDELAVVTVERYSVYWVDLNPRVGSEPAKTRPAVVVSDDDMNRLLNTVVVCPVTSRPHTRRPSRVPATVQDRSAEVAVNEIRTISKQRLKTKIGSIDGVTAESIRHAITQMYGVLVW